ncbi:hypothetical protein D3C76_1097640 [compost metagenome]
MPVLAAHIQHRLAVAEPADGFHFFNFVRSRKQLQASFKQIPHKIGAQPVSDNGNTQIITDVRELVDLLAGQKLGLVQKHAVGHGVLGNSIHVRTFMDDDGFLLHPDAGGDIAYAEPVVDGGDEQQHPFALFLIVVGGAEHLDGFAAVHGSIAKI